MKKISTLGAVLFASTMALSVPAQAGDPCAMVLCLAGEAMGQGGGGACSGPIKDYFKIWKTKKGKFNGGRTASARASKLNQCSGADASTKKMIGDKFGSRPYF